MATRDTLDASSNPSDGLHNLLAGLTAQSPGPSASSSSNVAASLPSSSGPSLEHLFNTPNRSIFSSGPPTASLSANVAQASLSGAIATNSSRPLSALTSTSASTARYRVVSAVAPETSFASQYPVAAVHQAEKDVDDPTTPMELNPLYQNSFMATPTALTRLFAATNSANSSRQASYNNGTEYTRATSEAASLPDHLYTRGFRDGRYSDITVHVFSTSYALHRLLLDRAPFFASALSEPWLESTAKEITLHPEELDSNITQAAFELALKRLYGLAVPSEERQEAAGLLATGCWLEMTDLVDSSVESLLLQMVPANLASVVELVTNNYYGRAGERLLKAAKTMLYREGWRMSDKHWDNISGDMVRLIIKSSKFYVADEWERWKLAWRLLNRRLLKKAMDWEMQCTDSRAWIRLQSGGTLSQGSIGEHQSPLQRRETLKAIYAHPDIVAMRSLLDSGIHYIHLTFEQLQFIREQKDKFGKPAVRGDIVLQALWKATELRQKVVNAPESSVELGLKHRVPGASMSQVPGIGSKVEMVKMASGGGNTSRGNGGAEGDNGDGEDTTAVVSQLDAKPYWIPSTDSTRIVSEKPDAKARCTGASDVHLRSPPPTTSSAGHEGDTDPFLTHLHNRTRAAKVPVKVHTTPSPSSHEKSPHQFYSEFPPFRFAVEFPNPRTMKERKRVYSRMVWYAGSIWNLYIQKVQTTKNMQLGVYLHRVRDREGEDLISGAAAARPRSVDETIGQMERDLLLRQHERRHRQRQVDAQLEMHNDPGQSSGDHTFAHGAGVGGLSNLLGPRRGVSNQSARRTYSGRSDRFRQQGATFEQADHSEDELDLLLDEQNEAKMKGLSTCVPALPSYVDGRPTIRTYFKIYQMMPDGRSLSVHKSAPDVFNFSQSWGWKTALDDSILGNNEAFHLGGSINSGGSGGGGGNEATLPSSSSSFPRDDRLRFCVVLGNI